MTISYVKKCADSVKISLINLAYDIFGLLAKNALYFSLKKHILFNKRKKNHGILLKITMYTAYICPKIISKFHKDIYYSFWDMDFQKKIQSRLRRSKPSNRYFLEFKSLEGPHIKIYIKSVIIILICKLSSIQNDIVF